MANKTTEVWASRKIARNVARSRMKKNGIAHPNKARYAIRSGMIAKLPSYFAANWRKVAAK